MPEYQVTQDGEAFYFFDPAPAPLDSCLFVISYMGRVRDLSDAQDARRWLIEKAKEWRWTLTFPNPFA